MNGKGRENEVRWGRKNAMFQGEEEDSKIILERWNTKFNRSVSQQKKAMDMHGSGKAWKKSLEGRKI